MIALHASTERSERISYWPFSGVKYLKVQDYLDCMSSKTIFPRSGKEQKTTIDISRHMDKIVKKNYKLLRELAKK